MYRATQQLLLVIDKPSVVFAGRFFEAAAGRFIAGVFLTGIAGRWLSKITVR